MGFISYAMEKLTERYRDQISLECGDLYLNDDSIVTTNCAVRLGDDEFPVGKIVLNAKIHGFSDGKTA